MTYHDNERQSVDRQLKQVGELQARVLELERQHTQDVRDMARQADRIEELRDQLKAAGNRNIEGYDQIVAERDEARAVAREFADMAYDEKWGSCLFCEPGGRSQDHAPNCPAGKVRAWDAPPSDPAADYDDNLSPQVG